MRTRLARSGASSSITSRVGISRLQWNGDLEACALAGHAVETDGAAVEVERLLHDRKPQSRARDVADVARPVESVEHPRMVLRRDADAAVLHLEGRRPVVDAHPEAHRAALGGVL